MEEEDGRRGVGVVTGIKGLLQLAVSTAKLSLATGTEGRAECQRICQSTLALCYYTLVGICVEAKIF